MTFETSAKVAAKVEALTEALLELSPGQSVTYKQLSRAAGEEISSQMYVMQRALKKAEQQSGAIFDNVHGQGYQRLHTHDIPSIGKKANSRIRKQARSTRKRLEHVRANDMTPTEVASIAAYRSHLGLIEGIANERAVKALEDVIAKAPNYVAPQTMHDRMQAAFAKKS